MLFTSLKRVNRQKLLFFACIFCISFIFRAIRAANFPPLLWDEAALGYNSYSILHTLKDEYGQFLPYIFKSFGDYKPGLYVYLTLPFISVFGLNEFSVRLPSIILGSLTPILLYLLIKEINTKAKTIGLLSAIVCAINPFNIHYSRGAWETNILTFQLLAASYFLFKFSNSLKSKHLLFSAIIIGLSLYTYQSAKLISLLLLIVIFLLNLKLISQNIKRYFLYFIIPFLIFCLPLVYGLFFQSNDSRIRVVSLFSYPRTQLEVSSIKSESSTLSYNLFQNENISFLRTFLNHYFNIFSPRFLLFEGDWQNSRHSAPYIGVILYPSLLFLVIGLLSFFSSKHPKKEDLFFLLWLLLAPIPAALTRDLIQATRSMSFSIPLLYFIAKGICFTLNFSKSKLLRVLIIFVYIFSLTYYLELYHLHLGKKNPSEMLYGYRQTMEYVIHNKNKFNNIYISDFYGQPYIFYLFYSKYPPSKYQNIANLKQDSLDTGKIEKIDNINFGSFDFQDKKKNPNDLLILTHDDVLRQGINIHTSNLIPLSTINNISTFYAYQTNE